MTFARACIFALMTAALVYVFTRADADEGGAATLLVLLAAGCFWGFTTDPLPGAVERGLDDFARKHRR